MNKIKFILPLIVILFASVINILSTQIVSAASLWDSTVINTESLILQEAGGPTIDVTTTWAARITTSPGSLSTTERDDFESAYLSGNYSVSLYKTTDGYGRLYVNYYSSTKNVVPCGAIPYSSCASPAASVNGFRMEDTSTISYGQIMMYYNGTDTFVQTGSHGGMVAAVFSFGSIQPYEVGFPITYPPGYEGPPVDGSDPKEKLYPKINFNFDNNRNLTSVFEGEYTTEDGYGVIMQSPSYFLFTLEDEEGNIITPDKSVGSAQSWNQLPLGNYRIYGNAFYDDEDINETTEFMTTEFYFQIDVRGYTVGYFDTESIDGRYCTFRNGYEYNCEITQEYENPKELITGEPEIWNEEECTLPDFPWINLGACTRNWLHYLGEYLGINGPSVQPGGSPFLNFDTNTFGLTAIIAAPISILTNLQNAEYTCTPVQLPLPNLSEDLTLPCMNNYYTTYLSGIYNIWQTIINGIVAYWVIVRLLKMVKDAKDPQKDQIEVLNL